MMHMVNVKTKELWQGIQSWANNNFYDILPKFVRTMELMTTFNCIKFYLHEVLSLSLSVTMTSNYGTMIKVWFKSCAKLDE